VKGYWHIFNLFLRKVAMKKYVLLSTYLFLVINVNCVAQTWIWAFDGNADWGIDLGIDQWGNLYSVSNGTGPFGQKNLQSTSSSILAKQDNNGDIIWANALGGILATALSVDFEGNCFITGKATDGIIYGTNNSKTVIESASGTGNGDAVLIKYNRIGDIQWILTWGNNYSQDEGSAITLDDNGDIFVAGKYLYNDGNSDFVNTFLRKYDSSGNLLWMNDNNWKGNISPSQVVADNVGNCYVTGTFKDSSYFDNVALAPNQSNQTVYLAKYNPAGQVIWAKALGTNYDYSHGLCIDNKNNLYLTGTFSSPSTFNSITFTSNSSLASYILKMDSSGIAIAGNSLNNARSFDIAYASSGNIYLTGWFKEQINFSNQGISTSKQQEIFVVRLDDNCLPTWALSPKSSSKGLGSSKALALDQNGNIFITGWFRTQTIMGNIQLNSPNTVNGVDNYYDVVVAKITDDQLQTSYTESSGITDYKIFPIPALGEFNIEVDLLHAAQITITVTNMLDQVIYSEEYPVNETLKTKINLCGHPRGIYYIIVTASGKKNVKKVIIE
jgi:hypothetical protein